ncbi:MAG: hypothetical protein V1676_01160 [Candidatus Diapherotrites archaeon]
MLARNKVVLLLIVVLLAAPFIVAKLQKFTVNASTGTAQAEQDASKPPVKPPTTPPAQTQPAPIGQPKITLVGDSPVPPGENIPFPADGKNLTVVYAPISSATEATLELWALTPEEAAGFSKLTFDEKNKADSGNFRRRQCYLWEPAPPPKNGIFEFTVKWNTPCHPKFETTYGSIILGDFYTMYGSYQMLGSNYSFYLVVENNVAGTWVDSEPVRLEYSDDCKKCDTILWCKACMDWRLVKSVFAEPAAAAPTAPAPPATPPK